MTAQLQSEPMAASRDRATAPAGPLYLLDGHSLTFKAYYGVRGLTAPDGMPTGAVFGFLRMLLRLIGELEPRSLAIVFDTPAPTFRSEIYPDYKANREAPPADFGDQMGWILRLLDAMGIATYSLDGYEADDLIATMASENSRAGGQSVIVSADKDLFQLVDDRTIMMRFGQRDLVRYDAEAVRALLGILPHQVPDWLALVGDPSDNIPGVPRIGEVAARLLLQNYADLDSLIEHAAEIPVRRDQQKSLIENVDQARMSLRLATVVRDVPLEWAPSECELPATLWNDRSIAIAAELGFDALLAEQGVARPAVPAAPAPDGSAAEYRIICEADELRAWTAAARGAAWVALDTETTGLDPMRAALVGMSLAYRAGEAIYIPVAHRIGEHVDRQLPVETVREILDPLLADPSVRLTAHHAKYDWKILERSGFHPAPARFDSMIASFVLDPAREGGHGLKSLAGELCGLRMRPITEIIGAGRNALGVDEVSAADIADYAALDADATLRLTEILSARLDAEPSLKRLFDEIEMPLVPVLHRMETGGVAVEPLALERLAKEMSHEIKRLTDEIWEAAGRQFNIDSTRQLAQVLFEDLSLTPGRKTKTGFSTDASVLEGLTGEHPVARLILQYRELTKLKSTYADALPRQINPATGRIHSSFSQTIATTGRLSSTHPNLQNIPVRTKLGREIRRAFVPDRPGHRLLSADYSQVELRILAHFSGDESLRQAYADGRDIHRMTAARIFGLDEADVTAAMRDRAKTINFGIIYGMSAHGLMQRLGITRAEASRFIEAYFAGYPGVRRWIDATLESAREKGYVETLMGRRRPLANINAKNGQLRAAAEREAVNTPIQGTSADMIKMAMIRIDRGLAEAAPGARMILQVHDELIFSVREEELEAAEAFVRREMIEAMPLDVPIVVDTASGANWADCK